MMQKIRLIRHAKTKGNFEGRYIGAKTDESLYVEGMSEVHEDECFAGNTVYSGYMKRCRQTAEILFPKCECVVVNNLSEIDFGDFENKNYQELNGNPDYQRWIDSGGKSDYPNGEKMTDFVHRSMDCFRWIISDMKKRGINDSAVVCHGGNIMAIMSELTGKDYFDFQVGNTRGIELVMDSKAEESDAVVVSYNFI